MATIKGMAAIEMAKREGLTLSKYEDPTEGAREGLSVAEAEEVAAEDPGLVYVETDKWNGEIARHWFEQMSREDIDEIRTGDASEWRDGIAQNEWTSNKTALSKADLDEIQAELERLARTS